MSDKDDRQGVLKLLKRFGIKADEAIVAHIGKCQNLPAELQLRITLEDVSDYDEPSQKMEPMVVCDSIRL